MVGIVGIGGHGGATPAYAVEQTGDGDVVVTVHRLDDAAGLEKALSAQGVDAEVSYDADGNQGPTSVGIGPDGKPVVGDELPPPPEGGTIEEHSSELTGGTACRARTSRARRRASTARRRDDPCGFDPGNPGQSRRPQQGRL